MTLSRHQRIAVALHFVGMIIAIGGLFAFGIFFPPPQWTFFIGIVGSLVAASAIMNGIPRLLPRPICPHCGQPLRYRDTPIRYECKSCGFKHTTGWFPPGDPD